MYVRINDDLRQKLALKWVSAKNKTKLAKEYSLSYNTIVNVLSGQTKEVRESTYDCLESLANGAPSHKEQSGEPTKQPEPMTQNVDAHLFNKLSSEKA